MLAMIARCPASASAVAGRDLTGAMNDRQPRCHPGYCAQLMMDSAAAGPANKTRLAATLAANLEAPAAIAYNPPRPEGVAALHY